MAKHKKHKEEQTTEDGRGPGTVRASPRVRQRR